MDKQKIESLYAFTSEVDKGEGVCRGQLFGGQFMTMVTAYEGSLNALIDLANNMATENNQCMKLAKFTNRQDLLDCVLPMTIAPNVEGHFFKLEEVCAFLSEDGKEEGFCGIKIVLDGQPETLIVSGNASRVSFLINQTQNIAKINNQPINCAKFMRKQDLLDYLTPQTPTGYEAESRPLKIEKLYAFISEGGHGEDLCGVEMVQGGQPTKVTMVVAADVGRLYSLLGLAQGMAAKSAQNIKLVKFIARKDLMDFTPNRA